MFTALFLLENFAYKNVKEPTWLPMLRHFPVLLAGVQALRNFCEVNQSHWRAHKGSHGFSTNAGLFNVGGLDHPCLFFVTVETQTVTIPRLKEGRIVCCDPAVKVSHFGLRFIEFQVRKMPTSLSHVEQNRQWRTSLISGNVFLQGGHTAKIFSNCPEADFLKKEKFEFTFNVDSDPS